MDELNGEDTDETGFDFLSCAASDRRQTHFIPLLPVSRWAGFAPWHHYQPAPVPSSLLHGSIDEVKLQLQVFFVAYFNKLKQLGGRLCIQLQGRGSINHFCTWAFYVLYYETEYIYIKKVNEFTVSLGSSADVIKLYDALSRIVTYLEESYLPTYRRAVGLPLPLGRVVPSRPRTGVSSPETARDNPLNQNSEAKGQKRSETSPDSLSIELLRKCCQIIRYMVTRRALQGAWFQQRHAELLSRGVRAPSSTLSPENDNRHTVDASIRAHRSKFSLS